jgi:hypothetical protein
MFFLSYLSSGTAIETHHVLDGSVFESQGGRDFLHLSRLALRPTQPPVQWVLGLFPWVKWSGLGIDQPPLSSAQVKNG